MEMELGSIKRINDMLDKIPITPENQEDIENAKQAMEDHDYMTALTIMRKLNERKNSIERIEDKEEEEYNEQEDIESLSDNYDNEDEEGYDEYEEDDTLPFDTNEYEEEEKEYTFENEDNVEKYPKELRNIELEKIYIGLLLQEPKLIVRYHILFDNCYFESESLLNIYKSILFTEGGDYTPEKAKEKFNFSKEVEGIYQQKYQLKKYVEGKDYNMEKIYTDLMKLCILRKKYTEMPIETIQEKIVEIANYELYDKMTIEEVESATNQVTVTDKFKQSVLNLDLTGFLEAGESNLANGLSLPFPILSSVFKGIRKGETDLQVCP